MLIKREFAIWITVIRVDINSYSRVDWQVNEVFVCVSGASLLKCRLCLVGNEAINKMPFCIWVY